MGVRFIAASQGIDTDERNPASKLLMHILAAVAEFERELIRERVSAGTRRVKSNGNIAADRAAFWIGWRSLGYEMSSISRGPK